MTVALRGNEGATWGPPVTVIPDNYSTDKTHTTDEGESLVRVSVYIEPQGVRAIKAIAKKEEMTLSEAAVMLMQKGAVAYTEETFLGNGFVIIIEREG